MRGVLKRVLTKSAADYLNSHHISFPGCVIEIGVNLVAVGLVINRAALDKRLQKTQHRRFNGRRGFVGRI